MATVVTTIAITAAGATTTTAVGAVAVGVDFGVLGDRLRGEQVRLALVPQGACAGASAVAASARCRWREPFGARREEEAAVRRQLPHIDEAKNVGVPACQDGRGLAPHDSVPTDRETEARAEAREIEPRETGHRAQQKPMLVTLACGVCFEHRMTMRGQMARFLVC